MPYSPDPRYAPDPRYFRVDRRYAPDPRFRFGQPPIGVDDPKPTDPLSRIRKEAREFGESCMIERSQAIQRAEAARRAKTFDVVAPASERVTPVPTDRGADLIREMHRNIDLRENPRS